MCHGAQPVGCSNGDRVQRSAQRLGQQLDPVQLARGGEDVRAVGALPPARLEQTALARRVQHAGQQTLNGVPTQQPAAELAQHAVVEARVGQVEGEQALPVNARPDRPGRLPAAQPLAELQQRDKGQAPGRIGRLAALGVKVGKACVVSEIQRTCAPTRRRAGHAAAGKGCRAGTQPVRHGPCRRAQAGWMAAGGATCTGLRRETLPNAAARTRLPNSPTVSGRLPDSYLCTPKRKVVVLP